MPQGLRPLFFGNHSVNIPDSSRLMMKCNLESQKVLFDLLHPEQIGVQLTEGFMMEPEASVSSLVFHHPGAVYFSVSAPPKPNGVQS